MNKAKVMRKAEAGEGLTVAEIKVYQKAVKPEKHVYGKYGTLAKQYLEDKGIDRFMKLVNKYSDITELNAEIIRTFVEKIIVYEAEKIDGVKTQRVKIVYNCVGTISVPNADYEPVKTDKTKIIEVA